MQPTCVCVCMCVCLCVCVCVCVYILECPYLDAFVLLYVRFAYEMSPSVCVCKYCDLMSWHVRSDSNVNDLFFLIVM